MSESRGATRSAAYEEFDLQLVLDTIDLPAFALDADGRVIAWGEQIADLFGVPAADVVGEPDLGGQFYEDSTRQTLAEKVVEAPRDAHEQFGDVDPADEEYALLTAGSDYVYEDRSTLQGQDIWFIAAPVYSGEEFVGVIEIVQDVTDSARHQRELEELFDAVIDTMEAFERGEFDATVPFETSSTILEPEFLRIIDSIEEMGSRIETMIREIEADIDELDRTADDVTSRSEQINELATEQASDMETISTEVENLSATVEEVASTADQVESTSDRAEQRATEGRDSAEEAMNVMESVGASAGDVAGDVDRLQERIAEIDEVVDVINDIAEQTNMLALNASIEAARAGEAGEGFAVVADEVKSLAEESQDQAGQIETMVDDIRSETAETVANLQETIDRVDDGSDQVEAAMERFEDIVDEIADTAEGISQVADATDDQAASAEEIASMVDEAVTKAGTVSEEVDAIASTTDRQAAMTSEISESVSDLTSSD